MSASAPPPGPPLQPTTTVNVAMVVAPVITTVPAAVVCNTSHTNVAMVVAFPSDAFCLRHVSEKGESALQLGGGLEGAGGPLQASPAPSNCKAGLKHALEIVVQSHLACAFLVLQLCRILHLRGGIVCVQKDTIYIL